MKLSFACLSIAAMTLAAVAPVAIASFPVPSVPLQVAQTRIRPVARVNPNRPIEIRVVNGGDATVVSLLTQPPSSERPVLPGRTVTFGSTRTSYLPLPIDFLVYPEDSRLGLSVDVISSNNVVTVVVGQQLSDSSPGRIAMNIDNTGAVYLF